MFGDEKNLKDPELSRRNVGAYGAGSQSMSVSTSYNRINKLITALYMVTDIIDEREPMRSKLRTLGTEVISDIYSISLFPNANGSVKASKRISEIISFLDIASTVHIISPMNSNILKKEFNSLKQTIEGSIKGLAVFSKETNLSEFFTEELPPPNPNVRTRHKGQDKPTRIGVQKGSTLMQVLSDKTSSMSNRHNVHENSINFDSLKTERRSEIISIIKNVPHGSTGPLGA